MARGDVIKPLVSVVIPAYNVEKYVGRCIESLMNQSYKNIELIIIDDGSSDKTVEIISGFCKKDRRIVLVKQQHCGPNMARKKGVSLAKGRYLLFVDSDDFVDKMAIEILIDKLKQNIGIDSIRFNAMKHETGVLIQPILPSGEEKIIGRQEIMQLLMTTYKLNSLWSQIYETKKLRRIKAFDYKVEYGEDALVNIEVHENGEKMLVIGDILYYYCENPDSTTFSSSRERIVKNVKDRFFVNEYIIGFMRRQRLRGDLMNATVFTQLASLCDTVLSLSKIRRYKFSEFEQDFSGVFEDNFLSIDEIKGAKKYIAGLSLKDKIKYGIMVKLVLSNGLRWLWAITRLYNIRLYMFSRKHSRKKDNGGV